MIHYELTRQERTQIDGRWHEGRAPACSTSDGHYMGFNPADFEGALPKIDCPKCLAVVAKHKLHPSIR